MAFQLLVASSIILCDSARTTGFTGIHAASASTAGVVAESNSSGSNTIIWDNSGKDKQFLVDHFDRVLTNGMDSMANIVSSNDYSWTHLLASSKNVYGILINSVNPLLGAVVGILDGLFKDILAKKSDGDEFMKTVKLLISSAIWEYRTGRLRSACASHAKHMANLSPHERSQVTTFHAEIRLIWDNHYDIFGDCPLNIEGEKCSDWQTKGGGGAALQYGIIFAESELQLRLHIIAMMLTEKKSMVKSACTNGEHYYDMLYKHYFRFWFYRINDEFFKYNWQTNFWSTKRGTIKQNSDLFSDVEMITSRCAAEGAKNVANPGGNTYGFRECVDSYKEEVLEPGFTTKFWPPIMAILRVVWAACDMDEILSA